VFFEKYLIAVKKKKYLELKKNNIFKQDEMLQMK
jgi:hypothetical protein